ncbi:MAG: hypothetical protein U9R38_05140 [Candidatus Margulisiibacteriota bacterium]|nr:hypothetical protein [Candidatus Margulisiibacteriota bacterium]
MKDTILWGIGVAVVLLMNSNKALRDEHHFRKLLLDNLKLILVLEFIVGFYAFSVLTEIVLVPLFVFVGIVSVVAEMKKEHSSVKRIMDSILAILGLLLILFALFSVFSNYQVLVTTVNLRSFLLPPLLTVVYLPFLYIFAIYMAYEELFVSLDFFLRRNKGIAKLAKRKILFLCRLNLGRIIRFSKEKVQQLSVSKNEADVLNVFQKN